MKLRIGENELVAVGRQVGLEFPFVEAWPLFHETIGLGCDGFPSLRQ